ncbi:unnamed protein product [Cylicocyclus nassatus]|uniref:Follistatin-like domain-containing protein n=1 Tax=Cylicocyclus nassatus TaxID=53992 RepID=A0AA36GEM7_CYLNA|nr:unnamed protein product [Cylicocyclus nassatus]
MTSLLIPLLFAALVRYAIAANGIDGNSCMNMRCEEGMVCVKGREGSECMAIDPSNNCNTLRCYGAGCKYKATECIPDKACFAEPTCNSGASGARPRGSPANQVPQAAPSAPTQSPPTGQSQPPCLAKCSENQRCVLRYDDNSCYNPPCMPVPTCVNLTTQPVDIEGNGGEIRLAACNLFCIQGRRCQVTPAGPRCVPIPMCAELTCPSGQTCRQDDLDLPAMCHPTQPVCGENEEVNSCGALCERKCENVGKGPIVCPLICLPPACVCKEGFYRNPTSGRCVPAMQCPPRIPPIATTPTTPSPMNSSPSPVTPTQTTPSAGSSSTPPGIPPITNTRDLMTAYGDEPITGTATSSPVNSSPLPSGFPPPANVPDQMTSYGDEPNTGVQASILIAGSSSSQPGACPTNETYSQCGNRCEPTCAEISGEPRLCPAICDPPACACAPGFYRLNGRCVTGQQCPGGIGRPVLRSRRQTDPMTGYGDEPALPEPLGPPLDPCSTILCRIGETCMSDENGARCVPPALQCSVNETVSNCGALCEGKCATVDEQNRPCPDICLPPACACSLGYFRNQDGDCVSAGDCPSRCPENEQINTCGRSCEPTCENAFGKIKVCNLICNPPACVCKPNFYRHNGACIPQMQCTPPRDGVGSIALDVTASTSTTSASSASNYVDEPVTPRSGNGRSYVDEPVTPRQGSGESGGSNVASGLECGANEEVGQCGNLCEPGCENAFGEPKVCIEICNPPACICRSNFYRKDGRCVSKSECPAPASGANGNNRYGDEAVTPASGSAAILSTNQGGPMSNPRLSCSVNETISQCGNLCEGKCENLGKGPIACPAICEPPACACKDGYYRIRGDRCVLGMDCELNCKTNEVVNSCGSACEPTCENAFGRPKVCDRVCRPAACVCRPNYYRNNGVCVPQSGCGVPGATASTNPIQITSGSTGGTRGSGGSAGSASVSTASQSGSGRPLVCGRNEVVGSCGNLCEPTCENAFGRPKICSRVCNPPACVCRPNYYRNNGTCIPQASCVDQVGLCEAMTCEEGTVCAEAESEQSARCQAEDPENNCETTDCPPDAVCEYRETECIPDKACFAEPVCVVYERIVAA